MKKLQRAVSGYGYVPPTMDDSKTEAYEEPEGLDKQVFINKLRQLTSPDKVDPDYTKRKSESDDLVEMLVWDTTQKSGGDWDNKIAAECYEQFRWLYQKQTAK